MLLAIFVIAKLDIACVAADPRTRLNPLCSIYRRFRASATQAKLDIVFVCFLVSDYEFLDIAKFYEVR